MSTMNYYVVLGIAEDADCDTIRSAFRALARRYHPDAGAGSSAAEFRRALEAYETLSDPGRRQLYDRQLRSRLRPAVIPEPIVSNFGAQPLFVSQTLSYGFPSSQMRITRSISVDDLFEEFFESMRRDWFWYRRWR
jgi:curved DNA-binding protein CbpA